MSVFTRRVASGNFPLYRLVVLGVLISGILQMVFWRVPPSVSNTSPSMFDFIYAGMQSAGAAMVLVGLYTRRAILSLNLERIGGSALATACGMYTISVGLNNGGPPLTAATWAIIMLAAYLMYRVVIEIPREVRALEAHARRLVRGTDGE